jgi:hypothetical protein
MSRIYRRRRTAAVTHYNVGVSEGRVCPAAGAATDPRRLDLVGVEARDEREAIAKLRGAWRALYGDDLPTELIGISQAY